ncbi:hypothetical protein ACWEKT_26590 [Nocardia takedensis]
MRLRIHPFAPGDHIEGLGSIDDVAILRAIAKTMAVRLSSGNSPNRSRYGVSLVSHAVVTAIWMTLSERARRTDIHGAVVFATDDAHVVVRASGTEPGTRVYLEASPETAVRVSAALTMSP